MKWRTGQRWKSFVHEQRWVRRKWNKLMMQYRTSQSVAIFIDRHTSSPWKWKSKDHQRLNMEIICLNEHKTIDFIGKWLIYLFCIYNCANLHLSFRVCLRKSTRKTSIGTIITADIRICLWENERMTEVMIRSEEICYVILALRWKWNNVSSIAIKEERSCSTFVAIFSMLNKYFFLLRTNEIHKSEKAKLNFSNVDGMSLNNFCHSKE